MGAVPVASFAIKSDAKAFCQGKGDSSGLIFKMVRSRKFEDGNGFTREEYSCPDADCPLKLFWDDELRDGEFVCYKENAHKAGGKCEGMQYFSWKAVPEIEAFIVLKLKQNREYEPNQIVQFLQTENASWMAPLDKVTARKLEIA